MYFKKRGNKPSEKCIHPAQVSKIIYSLDVLAVTYNPVTNIGEPEKLSLKTLF